MGRRCDRRKHIRMREFLASTDERFRPVYLSQPLTAHSTSSTSTTASFSTRDSSPSICAIRSCPASSITRTATGGFIGSCMTPLVAIGNRHCPRRRRRNWSRRCPHPNGWWRDTAQRLLVERGDRSIAKSLTDKAETCAGSGGRASTHCGRSTASTRSNHRRWSGRWTTPRATSASRRCKSRNDGSRQPNDQVQQAVLKRTADSDWAVRRQLAATLGALPANSAGESALVTMLDRFGDDPLAVDAAISGLRGREWTVLQRLLTDQTETPQRSAAITTLAATVVKGGQDSGAQALLAAISEESRAAWQRRALMSGVEVVLAGAPLPGAARARGNLNAAAANVAAAGARGGPGGARAFPDDTNARGAGAGRVGAGGGGAGDAGNGRGRGGGASLALSSEPAAFSTLARSNADLSTRASTVLARMTWPGKPAEPGAAPVAPLTPEQQKLYEGGQTLFNSLCMACHGDDGKGRTGLGPTLIGSQFALAPPVVPIRILLQGKEGSVGLMPPLGATLTDEQIAGALTYVRRQWGNAADRCRSEHRQGRSHRDGRPDAAVDQR